MNPKASRRKERIKIIAEINDTGKKKVIEKINETRSWFFKGINKIDKPLATHIKKKKEIISGRGDTTINTREIQTVTRFH